MGDVLFSTIEKWQSEIPRPFGKTLDAGTGAHSLKWLQSIPTVSQLTAITADEAMRTQILSDPSVKLRSCDEIRIGNWMDDSFCSGLDSDYDTIIADYLIGAVDGFSPYTQDLVIERLSARLVSNGRLYLIGMQPIPDHAEGNAEIITEVRRARDACIMLAGHRPYREYPLDWIFRNLDRSLLKVVKSKKFTILHSEESIFRQLRVAQSKLGIMNPIVRQGMERYLEDLMDRIKFSMKLTDGKIPLSFDYVVAAEHSLSLQSSIVASGVPIECILNNNESSTEISTEGF